MPTSSRSDCIQSELNLKPTPKVTTGFAAGAVTTIIIGILHRSNIDISPDEAAAITVILSTLAAYFAPRSKPKQK